MSIFTRILCGFLGHQTRAMKEVTSGGFGVLSTTYYSRCLRCGKATR